MTISNVHGAVELFAIINFTVVGLSHAVRPKAWGAFFADLRERGEAGVIGWAQVAKAAIYLLFPAFGMEKLRIPAGERVHLFIYPGLAYLAIAALLGYHLIATRPL